jgi:PAS domain S-box-containing protein
MNTGTQLPELVMPGRQDPSKDGQGTDLMFSRPNPAPPRSSLFQWLLLGLLAILVILLDWTCLTCSRAAGLNSANAQLNVSILLGFCLAVLGAILGAKFRQRQTAPEINRLLAANACLDQERDMLRTIIDALPDYIYAKDRQGRFLWNNPAHANDLGAASASAMRGKSDFDFFPRDLAQQFFADEQKIIATGESVINQEQYKARPSDPSGEKLWSLSSKVLWRGKDGRILGTVGITRDIHALKLTQEALRQSEEKLREFTTQLEQSNRELQDFAYVASHDLQEPLRKIVVFGERLKEKCGDTFPPEPRDYIERMQKAAARMQTLISDLLAFSRLTTKAHPFTSVNLAEIAREVLEDLESRIEQVHGRVEVADLPVLEADGLQMRQLLQNLIGNALKFRRPGEAPLVKVSARKIVKDAGREFWELSVSDNGIGFDEKYLDRIFNVFQRLHSRNEYEGTGMGLAIVRKIALHHGGDVTAHSQPGQGATFIVTLPTARPRSAEIQTNTKP